MKNRIPLLFSGLALVGLLLLIFSGEDDPAIQRKEQKAARARRYLHQQRTEILTSQWHAADTSAFPERPKWGVQKCIEALSTKKDNECPTAVHELGLNALDNPRALDALMALLADQTPITIPSSRVSHQGSLIPGRSIIIPVHRLAEKELFYLGLRSPKIAAALAQAINDLEGYPLYSRCFAARTLRFCLVSRETRPHIIASLQEAAVDESPELQRQARCTLEIRGWPYERHDTLTVLDVCGE